MEVQELYDLSIKCAYTVGNTLGYGFLESVYENAMLIELTNVGLRARLQPELTVYYRGQDVGKFKADIVVEDLLVIELKSAIRIAVVHEVQLVNYLNAIKIDHGLLINFAESRVEFRKKYRGHRIPNQ